MISELLNRGRENAIPARDLMQKLNLTPRDFYSAVERERRYGKPICASKSAPAGYYLAKDKTEIYNYTRMVNLTAHEMRRTARLMTKGARDLPEGD